MQGTTVDVEVIPAGGSPAVAGAYTYRGVVVFLLRGLNSNLPDAASEDSFWQPNGLAWRLVRLPGLGRLAERRVRRLRVRRRRAGWNGLAWQADYSD